MNVRRMVAGSLGVLVLALVLGAVWLFTLPMPAPSVAVPPIPEVERVAMLNALQPPKRKRPVIAVVAINDATETTDYLISYGILARAGVADVVALATEPGVVTLYPALKVEPQATIAQFDVTHPQGADYVIVPAMNREDDPRALEWIRQQSEKGAIVVSVCAGAKVIAAAGLLDGRRATTHWYYVDDLLDRHPDVHYVKDRRMVVDHGVATTTGITASMPMMLTLIEAIAGREKAREVAQQLGVDHWDARHDSDAYQFTRPFATTVLGNRLAFWNRETLGIPLRSGVDEVSLALRADAWSRSYRSTALTYAELMAPIETRHGLRIVPDQVRSDWPADRRLDDIKSLKPAEVLDEVLVRIGKRYGQETAKLVAMQLEYPVGGQ